MTAPGVPVVTVVIPCRNEAAYIGRCLDSIISGDFPTDEIEVLVVDGLSDDGTRRIAEDYERHHVFVRVLDNTRRIIPAAMNIGIRAARGDIVLKVDAHADYPRDYVSTCVRFLRESGADNVGGVLITEPSRDTLVARAIALVLAHPFGSGNSRFRIGATEPIWCDTAAFGCYRRDVFDRVGLYNENLVRSSDMDLNNRLRRAGGRILLVPSIVCRYYPRATLWEFFQRNLVDGYWALYPLRFGAAVPRLRHLVPLLCLVAGVAAVALTPVVPVMRVVIAAVIALYTALALGIAGSIAARQGRISLLTILPVVFLARHVGYALGAAMGAARWLLALASSAVPAKASPSTVKESR